MVGTVWRRLRVATTTVTAGRCSGIDGRPCPIEGHGKPGPPRYRLAVAPERELRELAELIGRQAAGLDVWEDAELCVLEVCLRERLALLGIEVTPELAAGLMATAQLLAERSPEWGGDARDTLAEVAVLGLRLLNGEG